MVATTGYSDDGLWASRLSGPSKKRTTGLHRLLGIEEVAHGRFDRLVVRRQRSVLQAAGAKSHPTPSGFMMKG